MSLARALQAILYPLGNGVVLAAVVFFWALLALVDAAGLFGLWLLIAIVPALMRFQLLLLQDRMHDRNPDAPGAEFFSLFSGAWSLFPVVFVFAAILLMLFAVRLLGDAGALLASVLIALVFPAAMIILALTRSPLESLNPLAHIRLIGRMRGNYLAPCAFLLLLLLLGQTLTGVLPPLLHKPFFLLAAFAFMSLAGTAAAGLGLPQEVDIYAPLEVTDEQRAADLDAERVRILNHAYGFVSRENRAGGLQHVYAWLAEDPRPAEGWAWFFNEMLRWERSDAALFFGQHYLHRLLLVDEHVAAVKLMLRCRLLDETWRPEPADLEAAINAAEICRNEELQVVLERLRTR